MGAAPQTEGELLFREYLISQGHTGHFVFDEQLGIIVWENAFAAVPLSRELFRGKFDLRWGAEDNSQRIMFRGEGLSDLEAD